MDKRHWQASVSAFVSFFGVIYLCWAFAAWFLSRLAASANFRFFLVSWNVWFGAPGFITLSCPAKQPGWRASAQPGFGETPQPSKHRYSVALARFASCLLFFLAFASRYRVWRCCSGCFFGCIALEVPGMDFIRAVAANGGLLLPLLSAYFWVCFIPRLQAWQCLLVFGYVGVVSRGFAGRRAALPKRILSLPRCQQSFANEAFTVLRGSRAGKLVISLLRCHISRCSGPSAVK